MHTNNVRLFCVAGKQSFASLEDSQGPVPASTRPLAQDGPQHPSNSAHRELLVRGTCCETAYVLSRAQGRLTQEVQPMMAAGRRMMPAAGLWAEGS